MLERDILRIKNNPIYQELKGYYSQSTIFSALGIERNENRHSAFLCWLLDPKSDHQLGVEPLKKFLALHAVVNEKIDDELRAAFITGRYNLEDIQMEREMTLSRFCDDESRLQLNEKQKRLDIWSEFSVSIPDSSEPRKIALVIENKIYSKEGKRENIYQTNVYHDCLSKYYADQTLLEVFLTPYNEGANCPDFLHLTYQQLLDDVLLPLASMAKTEHAKLFINDYIRNLGKPALNDDDDEKKVKTYSILATSELERKKLQQLLDTEGMKTIIEKALFATYGEQAKNVIGKERMKRNKESIKTYETIVLTEFWNDNTDILKAMLYNLEIFPEGKKEAIEKIFKESNRDTSKYVVEKKCGDQWVVADANYNRPLAKGRAACVFFAQWMAMNEEKFTLQQVRDVFPLTLNEYYKNSSWDFIDTLIFGSDSESLKANAVNMAGQQIELASDKWDFYPLKLRKSKCGWGYLKDGNMAIMPKMWRKEDFQRLLDHIDAHPELFSGLRIRQI